MRGAQYLPEGRGWAKHMSPGQLPSSSPPYQLHSTQAPPPTYIFHKLKAIQDKSNSHFA